MDDVAKKEAREWMESVTGETFHKDKTFGEELRSGVLLIKLILKIKPDLVDKKKVHMSADPASQPYKCMENISIFLAAAREIGCPETDLFPTVALFELKDITKVVIAVHSVGRYAQKNVPSFTGPHLGPKVATPNKRMFTRDQKDDAYRAVSLMNMGSAMTMDRGMMGMQSARVGIVDNRLNANFGVGDTKVEGRSVVKPRVEKTTQKHFEKTKDPKMTEFEYADENNKVPVTVRGSKWGAPANGKPQDRKMVSYAGKNHDGEHDFDLDDDDSKLDPNSTAGSSSKSSKSGHKPRHHHKGSKESKHRHHKRGSKHHRHTKEKEPSEQTFGSEGEVSVTVEPTPQIVDHENDHLENFVFARLRDIDVGVIEDAGELLEVLCFDLPNYKYGLGWKSGATTIKNVMKLGGGVGVVREKPDDVTVGVILWKPEGAVPLSGSCCGAFEWLKVAKQEYRGAIRTIHDRNEEQVSGAWEIMACAVVPDYRGKGIGKKLVAHVAAMAEKQELNCIMDVADGQSKDWGVKSGFKNLGRVNVQGHNYGSYLLLHKGTQA